MKTKTRRDAVQSYLAQHKNIFITEMASKLQVSSMTIRRDLQRLAELGIVTLVHGGAVLNEGAAYLPAVSARVQQMQMEINTIGAFCANQVKEGNAIYLDSGSTTKGIAEALLERQNIAVLTHSLPVMNILSTAKNLQLISIPGIYDAGTKGFFGEMARRAIQNFQIDIAFLGISAIDIENGIMSPDFQDQAIKLALIEKARQKIVVMDHTKIGLRSFTKVCGLAAIDMIVTDKMAEQSFIEKAMRAGVKVIQV